jgi:hypothetical protein
MVHSQNAIHCSYKKRMGSAEDVAKAIELLPESSKH